MDGDVVDRRPGARRRARRAIAGSVERLEVARRARARTPSREPRRGSTVARKPTSPKLTREDRHARCRRSARSARRIVPSPPSTTQRSTSSVSSRVELDARRPARAPVLARSPPGRGAAIDAVPRARASTSVPQRGGGVLAAGAWVRTVTTAGRSRLDLRAARRVRGRRARPSRAGLGQPDERLAVALRARAGPRTRSRAPRRRLLARGARPRPRAPRGAVGGSRTTPPLPTRSRPTSNCGLTIASASNRGAQQASTAGSTFVERDERDVGDDAGPARRAASPGVSVAGVAALDHGHARRRRAAPRRARRRRRRARSRARRRAAAGSR